MKITKRIKILSQININEKINHFFILILTISKVIIYFCFYDKKLVLFDRMQMWMINLSIHYCRLKSYIL
jgi:hypothetical protein